MEGNGYIKKEYKEEEDVHIKEEDVYIKEEYKEEEEEDAEGYMGNGANAPMGRQVYYPMRGPANNAMGGGATELRVPGGGARELPDGGSSEQRIPWGGSELRNGGSSEQRDGGSRGARP